MPTIPSSCTVCTGTCVSECGESCIGGCSEACTNTCTGTCSGSCMLECFGSCKIECSNVCGNACVSSCESECISSCMGMCQGCTGCSGTCEGSCVSGCLNSCQNEATNSGTRVVTEDEVLNYIANLKFKRISDFDENPAIFGSDMFATVVDGTLPTYDSLNAITILMESKEKKVFRASAAQLMDYLNRNLRNFIMWKPYSDGNKIRWKRTNDDSEPEPIDLIKLDFPLASETEDGIMSKEDFIKLKGIEITNYYTKSETDDIVSNLATVYAPRIHVHDQYLTIESANEKYYEQSEIENKLATKSDTTHNHDDVYLKISEAERDYATKELLQDTLESYTDTLTMNDLLNKKLNISDAFTIDQIPLASESVDGFMSSTHFSYIESIPTKLQNIKNMIPTTTGELENDAGFLVNDTLPIAGVDTLGIACVSNDSRATISDGYINIKDFGTVNFVRNSTFANGSDYWHGTLMQDASIGTEANGEYYALFIFNSGLSIYQTLNAIWADYVTFSIELKGTGTLTIEFGGETSDIAFNSTEWTRYQIVFPAGNIGIVYDVDLVISNNTEDSLEVYMRHIMVQNGLFATEWFPNYFDGNTLTRSTTNTATNDAYGIVKPDGNTIVANNGILTAISEIDDSITANNKTWSSRTISYLLESIPNLRLIGTSDSNPTPPIRIIDSQDGSGYGVVINKTSDKFTLGVTAADDAFGDITDEIGLRIDLSTGICDINGNAMTATNATKADAATNDANGNVIHETYVTIEEFNSVLSSIKEAIDALQT